MKTPREILFAESSDALPRLNRIRRQVLEQHHADNRGILTAIWEELFLPTRKWFGALTYVWLTIFILSIFLSDTPPATIAYRQNFHPSREIVEQLQAQNRLRRELLFENKTEPVAKPERQSYLPRPYFKAKERYEYYLA